ALRGQFNERLIVFLQGLSDLKVNQRLAEFQKRLYASAREYGMGILKFNALMSLQGAVMTSLAYFGMWFVLWVASPLVYRGALSGLLLAGLGLGMLVSFEAFLLLPQAVQHFIAGKEALSRLTELTTWDGVLSSSLGGSLCEMNRLEIKAEKVCFSYRALEGNFQEHKTDKTGDVREISLTLSEGKRLGIVGPSGSGKTTLINLLLGMFEPQCGHIYLDGKDLRLYDLGWWRSVVASCSQDDYLFQTTIRENLLFLNREPSEEKLWQALEATKLADLVRQLPKGLETSLGDQGRQLSGGERQRLLLARTLLRDAPLYIFDEPTANLDLATATEVIQNIFEWTKQRAVILVSHQAIGFEQVDEILVFAAGAIAQRGTHDQLLQVDGYYAQLWRNSGVR
ncbi:MAG: ABC transporter ATP-binding protein/permease, partial [Anaerolineales bacterium]|nr:ABC transporter ATP-binding protein/permease [Anaerolineales bacterium]